MRVVLAGEPPSDFDVLLREEDDLQSFCVELPAGFQPAVGTRIGPVRLGSATQAWVDRDWLIRAGRFGAPPRSDAFAAMVSFAARSGWVDEASREIAGHVVRGSGATRPPVNGEEQPMGIEGIDNVGIAVGDLDRVTEFFAKQLGLEVEKYEDAVPPAATVTVGDRYLYVFAASGDPSAATREASLSTNSPGLDHISFRVPDVDGEVERLRERGVEFEGEPETVKEWSIRLARFRDPEGNSYYLVQNL
jgi:catechol 2,3-dioxygenase-like lactoylglutathione lyase family enzyme